MERSLGALKNHGAALSIARWQGFLELIQMRSLVRRRAGLSGGIGFSANFFGKCRERLGDRFSREIREDLHRRNRSEQCAADFGAFVASEGFEQRWSVENAREADERGKFEQLAVC